MASADILQILYAKQKTPEEFNFDAMWAPTVFDLIPPFEVDKLRAIATSIKLSSKIDDKYKMIKDIVEPYGFRKLHAGTNRVVYRHLECTNIVMKIAIDDTGMTDNPREFENQQWLKPFVTKTFDVSPCGTVAISERIQPITTKEEFLSISEDIFDLITENIIGEYILEDIGTKFFRNWGIRNGFGPVLLDYPYVFRLDGAKLYCNKDDPITGEICGGEIDYDDGFNFLRCTKCGAMVEAKLLKQDIKQNKICIKNEELNSMIVNLVRGNDIISGNEIAETRATTRNNRQDNRKRRESYRQKTSGLKASLMRGNIDYTNDIKNVKEEVEDKMITKETQRVEVKSERHERRKTPYDNRVKETKTEERPVGKGCNKEDKVEYDTTSQFMKNGIKEEQDKVVEEEQNDFLDEATIKEMQEKMTNGFGISEDELNQNQHEVQQKIKEESHEEEPSDEIEEKYKEYANDDSYNPTQKISNKKALEQF